MVGEGGSIISLPSEMYNTEDKLLSADAVVAISSLIMKYYDDEAFYVSKSNAARKNYETNHRLETNVDKAEKILMGLKCTE